MRCDLPNIHMCHVPFARSCLCVCYKKVKNIVEEALLLYELSEREPGWRFTARCHMETMAKPDRLGVFSSKGCGMCACVLQMFGHMFRIVSVTHLNRGLTGLPSPAANSWNSKISCRQLLAQTCLDLLSPAANSWNSIFSLFGVHAQVPVVLVALQYKTIRGMPCIFCGQRLRKVSKEDLQEHCNSREHQVYAAKGRQT